MANDVKTMETWEASCVEVWASLKGKPICLCCRTEHCTKCVSIISTIYDGPPTSESIVFISEGSADCIVVGVSDTGENALNVDKHDSQLATVVA